MRKATLALHLTVSIGWIGTIVAYLALGVSAVNASDDEAIRSAWVAMETVGWYAIVPLSLASLVTGVVMSIGTRWGLVRHHWVLISLVLTGLSVGVLLLHMPDVTATVAVLDELSTQELATLGGDLAHPAIGLVVLLVVLVLNVYKPRGLTRYGHRRQHGGPPPRMRAGGDERPSRRNEERAVDDDLRDRSPEEVFDDHLRLAAEHRFDEDIERNVSPDAVILDRRGIFRGREGARELARLLEDELPDAPYVYTNRLVEGRFAFLEWTAEAAATRVRDGADSFVIEDGWIVAQTIHYTVESSTGTST